MSPFKIKCVDAPKGQRAGGVHLVLIAGGGYTRANRIGNAARALSSSNRITRLSKDARATLAVLIRSECADPIVTGVMLQRGQTQ